MWTGKNVFVTLIDCYHLTVTRCLATGYWYRVKKWYNVVKALKSTTVIKKYVWFFVSFMTLLNLERYSHSLFFLNIELHVDQTFYQKLKQTHFCILAFFLIFFICVYRILSEAHKLRKFRPWTRFSRTTKNYFELEIEWRNNENRDFSYKTFSMYNHLNCHI